MPSRLRRGERPRACRCRRCRPGRSGGSVEIACSKRQRPPNLAVEVLSNLGQDRRPAQVGIGRNARSGSIGKRALREAPARANLRRGSTPVSPFEWQDPHDGPQTLDSAQTRPATMTHHVGQRTRIRLANPRSARPGKTATFKFAARAWLIMIVLSSQNGSCCGIQAEHQRLGARRRSSRV